MRARGRAGGMSTHRPAVARLRLSHYRSYRTVAIDTGGASIALHGPNGAGKTNLLEAVSLLTPGRGLRRAATDELIRRPEALGWKITADLATADGPVEIVTAAEGAEATRRTVLIDDKRATQGALGRIVRAVWLTPAMDRLWIGPAGDRRRFLDRVTLGFEPAHAETSAAYEKVMRDRNRLLKDGVFNESWLCALETQMARAGARIARARAQALARVIDAQETGHGARQALFPRAELSMLGDMETRFARAVRDAANRGDDLDEMEADEAAGLALRLADARARDAAAGRALEGPHRSDLEAVYAAKAMPARACSTGEQKALLISLCLANARALADHAGSAPLLLLDEVSAHLDAERRRALYAEIEALGSQAWVTGTAPDLFDGLADARLIGVADVGGMSALEA